jgi:hypothetical protein
MIRHFAVLGSLAWLAVNVWQDAAPIPKCSDPWPVPVDSRVVEVDNVSGLESAFRLARPGDDIVLADGDYALRAMLDIAVPNVTVRGRNGDPVKVVLHGRGMVGDAVGVAVSVSAPGVTLAHLTIRDVGYHAIQVRGERGASQFTLHHARLMDTGEQLLKGSVSNAPIYADNGLVACSEFSYTTSAPTNYTNAVDLLATKGWVIRDNRFARIRGPESDSWRSGPTILAWKGAEDTLIERNLIIDSFRGIALGLTPGPADLMRNGPHESDHLRGIVRNNVIVNLNSWADEAIEANAAADARIEHNTVFVSSRNVFWSIGVRFPIASAVVRNNLTNQMVLRRNGGQAAVEGNVMGAGANWFIDASKGDLHLAPAGSRAVDAGVMIEDVTEDFDRQPRVTGRAPDAGAFETRPAASVARR